MLTVRQLLPEPADIDPAAAHAIAARPAPTSRPWVLVNMVTSVDGATAIDGVSGGLGGRSDKAVFAAIRAIADIILVAAGTARAESYGPPRTSADRQAERTKRGQTPYPRLALVSRSLDLDPDAVLFTQAPEKPLVFTVSTASAARREALGGRAEVVDMDGQGGGVDLPKMMTYLHNLGARTVLAEGGPGLNGQLVADGLLDELNLSLSPILVGGDSARLTRGADASPEPLTLAHLWESDGMLFARYVRRGGA